MTIKTTSQYIFLILILFSSLLSYAQTIKVACIGNSVTYGLGIDLPEENGYPSQLGSLLGNTYDVVNFGHSGATLLKNGHKPYHNTVAYKNSLAFQPNIVVIHLGLNDQGNNNWPKYKEEFVQDYIELINAYKALPSRPRILICKMTPTFSGHHWFEEGMRENFKEVQQKIEEVAAASDIEIIDLHDPLYRYPEFFPDNLHPTKEGAAIIAQKVNRAIKGNSEGLHLSPLYGENMVLQRNEPIVFEGTGKSKDQISISFNSSIKSTNVLPNGIWNMTFPEMDAGGPYKMSITSRKSGSKTINKVYIGEVWLASGQSNMDFEVKNMQFASSVLRDSISSNVFLFSMDGKVEMSNQAFSEKELAYCNTDNYFAYSGWSNKKGDIISNFSAIAYSFAYNLEKEINIPIGIICNAVGGSPTQSWISRESMELTHETIDILNDTHLNPLVDTWVSERRETNMQFLEKLKIKARHPYDPTMLFDTGILPITKYNIKGVLWYQGESNTEHVDLHSNLFKMLVADWRLHWNKPKMPFYYVQLSSINRPNWGEFRDVQRRLMDIPNTGMAVSLDVGHPTDVHPNKKWIIGKRLSKIAMAKSYGTQIAHSGPLLDFINIEGNKLEVHFLFGDGLTISEGDVVQDISIAGMDKKFVKATTEIIGSVLMVWSPEIEHPRYVKYGYTPFTQGNLVNKAGLPASTFTNLNK